MKKIISIILLIITFVVLLSMQSYTYATSHTAGEVIKEADGFIQKGQAGANGLITQEKLKELSDTIYNILLVVGIIAAVLIGVLLGIKFMTSGVEGKAEVQKALIIYVMGCVVVFGAFTIWKIVVTVLQGI
ncbi:MAG: hypothetical protein HFJ41_01000 [Clostridia bacterium]|nr:hypothetical protein [Clostridia bacterium]